MEVKKLTALELSNLWSSYLTNTMTFWVTKYFLANTQDRELHTILEYAEEIAMVEVKKAKAFLEEANQPLPQGFDKEDVEIESPAICTDNFILIIKYNLAQSAQLVYSAALSSSTRKDIRQYYQECIKNTVELYNRVADLMIKKGLHHPEVHIPIPSHVEKVSKQNFLAGWFADRRPINAVEINQLVFNFRSTEYQKSFIKIFSQVTPTNELKKHFQRGVEMLQKQLDIFQSILTENDLPKLPTLESELLDITVSPFSERLMLYKLNLLIAGASSRYGAALSSVQRKDLGSHFMRLMTESLQYGEDNLNLMIERGFLDQLPMAKEIPSNPSSS